MAKDHGREQSPHYIPELDPCRNGSDEGQSELSKYFAIQMTVVGLFVFLMAHFFDRDVGKYFGGVMIGLGLVAYAFWSRTPTKRRVEK